MTATFVHANGPEQVRDAYWRTVAFRRSLASRNRRGPPVKHRMFIMSTMTRNRCSNSSRPSESEADLASEPVRLLCSPVLGADCFCAGGLVWLRHASARTASDSTRLVIRAGLQQKRHKADVVYAGRRLGRRACSCGSRIMRTDGFPPTPRTSSEQHKRTTDINKYD